MEPQAREERHEPRRSYQEAVGLLLPEFAWNPWFGNTYWPENEPRVRRVMELAAGQFAPSRRALEVGCANGYVAYLARLLGFEVEAIDAYDDAKRAELFLKGGIRYHEMNLNAVNPLSDVPSDSFDLVLLGEVFEHILNQPAGLLKSIFRILRPGGLLILTTPNPSTIANAIRVLNDHYLLWGTPDFLNETKIDGNRIIDHGGIHYREYPAWVVRDLLKELGYEVRGIRYVQAGVAPTQPALKRAVKRLIQISRLGRLRLLSPGYVIWAAKP